MKEKKLRERCKKIFSFFDHLNRESGYGKDIPIRNLIFPDEFYDELEPLIADGTAFDEAMDLLWPRTDIAFALGFIIGKEFDITYPGAQADLDYIREVIKEKVLLPYLPREKKAAHNRMRGGSYG